MTTLRMAGGMTRPHLQLFVSGENVEIWMTLHENGREWVRLGAAPTLTQACDEAVDALILMIRSIYEQREAAAEAVEVARRLGLDT